MGIVEHDARGTSGVEVPERTSAGDGATREVSRTCLLDLSVGLVEDVRRDGVHRDMGPEDSATIFRCAFRIAAFVCGTSVAMTSAAICRPSRALSALGRKGARPSPLEAEELVFRRAFGCTPSEFRTTTRRAARPSILQIAESSSLRRIG
jgi:hypothetical protein